MTNTFRKHHKTFMWVIIVGMIISFVYFLSPTARNGPGGSSGPSANYGSVNGEAITQVQWDNAVREARIVFRMTQGRWPSDQDTEAEQAVVQFAYQRLFLAAKLNEMKITVPDDTAARYMKEMLGIPPDQAYPKDKLAEFVLKELNQAGKVGFDDFDRFIRHQAGQQLLINVFGMNGQLITQKEAEFFFRRENESMSVELARFPLTNYTAQINPTPQEIESFYTNNQADYRMPERVQVNYILFNQTNYLTNADQVLAAMSNLDSQIEQTYVNSDPSSFKDDAGNQLSEADAKLKIKDNGRHSLARQAAYTNATDLTTRLFEGHDKTHPVTLADLKQLAATNGLTVQTTQPFDELHPPAELQLSPKDLGIVFQLDFGDPDDQYKLRPGTNGIYLIGLEKKFPSESQPLEAVRAKVIEDFRNGKALEMASQAGTNFEAAARAGLAAHQSFDAICAAQKVKPEALSPFTSLTRSIPEVEDQREFNFLVRVAFEMPSGQCSQYAPTPSGGFVAYVKSRTPLDEAIVQRDIPTYLAKMRRDRQVAAYQGWMQREMQLHVVPAAPKSASPS